MGNRLDRTLNGSGQGKGDLCCINSTAAAKTAIDPLLKTLEVGGGRK